MYLSHKLSCIRLTDAHASRESTCLPLNVRSVQQHASCIDYLTLSFVCEDYSAFAHSEFDPNDYANALLAGEPYPQLATSSNNSGAKGSGPASTRTLNGTRGASFGGGSDAEDISVAVSKLTFNIDEVEKQLKNVVRIIF